MRIRWDESKRQLVLQKRRIDFSWLGEMLISPCVEDRRSDDPEQYRLIGFAKGRLLTFIVEYRQDSLGDYLWAVTAWYSTKQEQRIYEQETN
jgi:uncharacterized DUF497 family protein